MQTPIIDFVKNYAEQKGSRFHMPGHKGQAFLGCEELDITEIAGADALYEAEGIIAESEQNAAKLFGTAKTVFSTEGSSQCIRAILKLAVGYQNQNLYKINLEHEKSTMPYSQTDIEKYALRGSGIVTEAENRRPYVIAARNVHKAFLYAAALIDFDVVWLYPKEMHSLCSCKISAEQIETELCSQIQKKGFPPAAVYVTSPDYLGGQLDIAGLTEVCHRYHTILAVDNAHGAYLHFLEKKQHPIDLGADICCDSSHKTLPVLTGGAYLQISKNAPNYFVENAKQAMVLFGSTSPSYLILSSLDLCNRYLAEGYKERLAKTAKTLENIRARLKEAGWVVEQTDPLKLSVQAFSNMTGIELADELRKVQIECEYADERYLVLMATAENTDEDFAKLLQKMQEIVMQQKEEAEAILNAEKKYFDKQNVMQELSIAGKQIEGGRIQLQPVYCEQKLSIREAVFASQEQIKITDAIGRICGVPTVGCPPAIPIAVAGEVINEEAVKLFEYYGIKTVSVVRERI